eukprot:6178488-Pleurochrysis_carterae.AAC.2
MQFTILLERGGERSGSNGVETCKREAEQARHEGNEATKRGIREPFEPQIGRLAQLSLQPFELAFAEEWPHWRVKVVHEGRVGVERGSGGVVARRAHGLEAGGGSLRVDVPHAEGRRVRSLLVDNDEAHHERLALVVERLGP